MSLPDLADTRRRADRSVSPVDAGYIDEAGVYVTDEVFLYRVVDFVAGRGAGMVELEDCFWLDVVRVPLADFRARRLRVVFLAPAEG